MKQKICKDCENPLPPNAEYCGRCGAGVRQVPIGCAIVGILGLIGGGFLLLRFIMTAIGY